MLYQFNTTPLCSSQLFETPASGYFRGSRGTLCEYSQSDRSVLRCVMSLAQSMTFLWMRASKRACMQTPRLLRIVHSFRREGQRWKDLDQRHEVGKKKKGWKKVWVWQKKKKQTSFYEAGEQKTAWQGSRRVIKETGWKRQKSQRQDASVPQQLLKGAAFFSRYIAAKLTVLTTLHTQPPCTLELTAFIWWRVSPAHGSKNFSVGNIA